ncbi:hypothetical protein [Labilibaculum antarcticum]|uniref:hypothetical protein n=1 Tax=Labilibaculum antarcticum TaxID=1717717 RepID=UPI0012931496|nr:hypothetical protein [Labilibaculum antarcticum]
MKDQLTAGKPIAVYGPVYRQFCNFSYNQYKPKQLKFTVTIAIVLSVLKTGKMPSLL